MGRKKQAQQKRSSRRTETVRQKTPPKPYRGLPPASPPLSPREYLEVHSLDPLDSLFVVNETVAANESALEDTIVGGENLVPIEATEPTRAHRQLVFDSDESSDGDEHDRAFIEEPAFGPRRAKHCITYRGLIRKVGPNNPAEVIRYLGENGDKGRWFFRPVYGRFCKTSHGFLRFNEELYEGTGDDLERILKILDKIFRNRTTEMAEFEEELNRGEIGVVLETKTHLLPLKNIQFGIASLKKTDPDRRAEHDEAPAYASEP
ncbi:Oidioi.mRNA.OKI2018_I69.chr1.g430.t1.cds [Oikopleura dioica]|uniref:Oidioi.mRNA.OKI2018_I69.chr1.g430.t1.cds n=1 Tax=Oikopleura dioica TaxID=34765 RepID=A0ABN7SNP5_OIKDI|nr:Oidioi.mRNA.OKI2018_I69.chr1.g430.t1.cds [Oikopleura dioica]